jgi:hypothetical protein
MSALALLVVLFGDVTAVSELAEAAYDVSVYAREGRVGGDRFAHYCLRSADCRGECGETLQWLSRRRERDPFLGKKGPKRPARLCTEAQIAGATPEKLDAWVRARFLRIATEARHSAAERDADRLDCAFARLDGKHRSEACLRVEPAEAARMLHECIDVDQSTIPTLMFKGCEGLDGCSGECRGELFQLASPIPKPPKPSKCELPPPSKGEKANAWRARIFELAWRRLASYYRDQVLPKLGLSEQSAVQCDLSKLKLGPTIPGC